MISALNEPWSWLAIAGWIFLTGLVGLYELVGYRRKDDSIPTLTNLFKRLVPEPGRDSLITRLTDWLKRHFSHPGGTR